MNAQNFSVMINLATPIVVTPLSYLMLDALLAARIYALTGDVERAHSEIPLDKEAGLWCGSAMFLSDLNRPISVPFKRGLNLRDALDPLYVAMGAGRNSSKPKNNQIIDTVRGPYANLIEEYQGYEANYVVWFGRGDINAVENLLKEVRFVGKKHHQGYGSVATRNGLIIEEEDENNSIVGNFGGKKFPMRPIPIKTWDESVPYTFDADVCFQPPYFNPRNAVRCVVPHTKAQFWA